MTPTDEFSQRVEAIGLVLIALVVVVGSGLLLNVLLKRTKHNYGAAS